MIDKHLNFKDHLLYIKYKIKRPQKIIDIMKWKKCSKWHIIYSWLTYIAPHFRYGALIFYKLSKNSHLMDNNSAKFLAIERLYNSTVKQAFKIP